jgi:hypothetical protein
MAGRHRLEHIERDGADALFRRPVSEARGDQRAAAGRGAVRQLGFHRFCIFIFDIVENQQSLLLAGEFVQRLLRLFRLFQFLGGALRKQLLEQQRKAASNPARASTHRICR